MHQIKDAFDQFGKKIMNKGSVNLDDVFNAEQGKNLNLTEN